MVFTALLIATIKIFAYLHGAWTILTVGWWRQQLPMSLRISRGRREGHLIRQKKQRINAALNLSTILRSLVLLSNWEITLKNSPSSKYWGPFIAFLVLTLGTVSYADNISLQEVLDENSKSILLHHEKAQTAYLKVVSIADSQENALNTQDRIAGYPIIGQLKDLNHDKSSQLVNILLDKNNYSNIRQRCVNSTLDGVRFSSGEEKVEIVIGSPCNQVFVAFRRDNKTEWWGSTLGEKVTKKALKLLCNKK